MRELEPGEAPGATKPIIDLRIPAERAISEATPILAEMSGKIYRFASPEQLREAEARLEAAEEGIGPRTLKATALLETSAQPQIEETTAAAPSAWTTGGKKILIIRVDFSDLPGDPQFIYGGTTYTAAYVQNLADTQISPYYLQSSYALTSLTNTVTTQVYRMPQTAAYYAVNNANSQLHSDAETAAAANYTLSNYDRIIVLFSWLGSISGSGITYGGLAQVGGPDVWANGEFDFRVVAHELGHTYGLWHANLWQVSDGNPVSPNGSSTEYGDDFDTMGANFANDTRTDFNPWFKNTLGWISDTQVLTVTSNGTYRIYRFDNSASTGTFSLKIGKDSTHNYWISCRRNFTDNASMQNGAYIIWGYNGNTHSDLLDMTTPGNSDQDAALAVGTTFTDSAASITIQPTAEGGTTPHEYVDVQVAITKDSVGDTIPDWWRAQYFGDNGATTNSLSCATCDADGTGQNNLFKYMAGLDPTNPASVFVLQIQNVPGQPTQKNLIYQPIASGHTYVVQSVTNLVAGVWSPQAVSAPLTNGTQVTVTDPNAAVPFKFYRVNIYNIITNIVVQDSVGDGIPDSWRAEYFPSIPSNTTNGQSCATCDADGTGQNNLFKYVAGLNPTNPTSVFVLKIANVSGVSTQKNLIYNPIASGRTYTPQFSTNLTSGAWATLTGISVPVTNANQVTITDLGATQTNKFYRLQITYP
ncbi:MAG: hypothetical protein ABSH14_00640 [Verrucomicrobiia bacterium]